MTRWFKLSIIALFIITTIGCGSKEPVKSGEATKATSKGMSSSQKKAHILVDKGLIASGKSKYEEAIKLFDEAIAEDKNCYDAYYYKGFIAWGINADTDTAFVHLNKALKINPKHIESLVLTASLYDQQGDKATAEKYAKKAASLGSESAKRYLEKLKR
jgi:tetratricopeptide (TPR) repeat protein